MTYVKPELVTQGIAVSLIQGGKECPTIVDVTKTVTPGAYESDE